MAQYDITRVEYLKQLTSTNTDSYLANPSASYETQITSICVTLQTGGATARTVTFYKNGTNAANEIFSVVCDPAGEYSHVITDPRIVLTGTQTLYIKQNTGTDCNVLISAIKEEI